MVLYESMLYTYFVPVTTYWIILSSSSLRYATFLSLSTCSLYAGGLEEINKVFCLLKILCHLYVQYFMERSKLKYHVVINETFRHKLFDERSCESLKIDETYLSFFVTMSWTRNVLFRPHLAK